MSDEAFALKITGLDQLVKALKVKPPVARVGILGDKTVREPAEGEEKTLTNAEVGAAHEFGTPTIPKRSFLIEPIRDNLEKEMLKSGALDKKVLAEVVKQGSVIPWVKKVAALAEGIVLDAFDTSGFGKWKAWKNPNYKNNAGQILVDTKQLRDSISSEVRE
jgi:phage gpG-like protein